MSFEDEGRNLEGWFRHCWRQLEVDGIAGTVVRMPFPDGVDSAGALPVLIGMQML
jgi:hypothetical protein